jgi:hypothetical protein
LVLKFSGLPQGGESRSRAAQIETISLGRHGDTP